VQACAASAGPGTPGRPAPAGSLRPGRPAPGRVDRGLQVPGFQPRRPV